MNPIQYLRIYKSTKTLMSLLDGISYFYGKKQVFIIDQFSENVPISDVINMKHLYNYLKETYQIHVFDKKNISFDIKILYGTPDVCVDLTSLFYNGRIFIPKDTDFTPYPKGKLYIVFTINGIHLQQVFDKLEQDYVYETECADVCFNRAPELNYVLQETIYSRIELNEAILQKATLKYNTSVVNCLHIKVDEIIHSLSTSKNIQPIVVKQLLENSYTKAIKEHFEKYDTIIVIGYNKNIIDFLERENYVYELSENYFDNKEKNTMVDYARSKWCNHFFIGKDGSTMSYYIGLNIKNKILI